MDIMVIVLLVVLVVSVTLFGIVVSLLIKVSKPGAARAKAPKPVKQPKPPKAPKPEKAPKPPKPPKPPKAPKQPKPGKAAKMPPEAEAGLGDAMPVETTPVAVPGSFEPPAAVGEVLIQDEDIPAIMAEPTVDEPIRAPKRKRGLFSRASKLPKTPKPPKPEKTPKPPKPEKTPKPPKPEKAPKEPKAKKAKKAPKPPKPEKGRGSGRAPKSFGFSFGRKHAVSEPSGPDSTGLVTGVEGLPSIPDTRPVFEMPSDRRRFWPFGRGRPSVAAPEVSRPLSEMLPPFPSESPNMGPVAVIPPEPSSTVPVITPTPAPEPVPEPVIAPEPAAEEPDQVWVAPTEEPPAAVFEPALESEPEPVPEPVIAPEPAAEEPDQVWVAPTEEPPAAVFEPALEPVIAPEPAAEEPDWIWVPPTEEPPAAVFEPAPEPESAPVPEPVAAPEPDQVWVPPTEEPPAPVASDVQPATGRDRAASWLPVAPVELRFSDEKGRVGVHPGSPSYEEYRRIANRLFAEMRRAWEGR
ncbi:MAG: hypothetical protein WC971_00940 [Coriobacteriia bacterium]